MSSWIKPNTTSMFMRCPGRRGLMWLVSFWMEKLANSGDGSNSDLSKMGGGLDGRPSNMSSWSNGDHHRWSITMGSWPNLDKKARCRAILKNFGGSKPW